MSTRPIQLNANGIPAFDDLPLRAGDPHHSAWGLYGDDDELGTLNRLTDERVVAAAKAEIRTGKRISLNWPLSAQTASGKTFFGRALFHQELIHKAPRFVNDDIWTFNSQVSSQWDGLRHYGYQEEELFYNGVSMADVHGENYRLGSNTLDTRSTVNGIQAMSEQGIIGRGILLDYDRWRLAQHPPPAYDPFASDIITLAQLRAVAAAQGTELRFGDILLVRSGYLAAHAGLDPAALDALKDAQPPSFAGLEQSEDVLRWIWENFSAVAGDQPSFESWPSKKPYKLHEVLLGGWGCPIGELFDLEKLAEHCANEQRWSFFVTSEVCNVPGGVASPPNIIAIF